MTREETIKGLTSLLEVRRKYCDMRTMKDEMQCLDMAIKALEQEPCEDAISRKVVLEIVERVLSKGDALFEIEKLPSVKPQDTKEIYNKGFADGQKALAEHLKLCKEELLDKIRAEIDEKKQKINFNGLGDYEKAQAEMRLSTLNELLQIIDKYKTESEAQE